MNKKAHRPTFRAPTTQPVSDIAPSGTLAMDGELPLSASNGVTAPEPLAAHDVLQAAMVQPEAAPSAEQPAEPVAGSTGKPAKKAVREEKAAKPVKEKFVEISFTLPQSEVALLNAMKKTHEDNGVAIKKSQLLRAALLALADVDADRLAQLVAQLPAQPVVRKKKK